MYIDMWTQIFQNTHYFQVSDSVWPHFAHRKSLNELETEYGSFFVYPFFFCIQGFICFFNKCASTELFFFYFDSFHYLFFVLLFIYVYEKSIAHNHTSHA